MKPNFEKKKSVFRKTLLDTLREDMWGCLDWGYVRLFGLRNDRVDLWGWFIVSLQIYLCY